MKGKIARFSNRKEVAFGDLKYTIYFKSKMLTSGIAVLPAGGKGDVDSGHKDAEEVFTINSGSITVSLPDSGARYELGPGDALLIPPGEPHIVENNGKKDAVITFTAAPGL
jgi:mannose-6-phosphate isomerase-like protein (cupin superfamily)